MAQPGADPRGFGRRTFIRAAGGAGLGFVLFARLPGGMAKALAQPGGRSVDYYEISVRQLRQQILSRHAGTGRCG